jgi:hypothetical protein
MAVQPRQEFWSSSSQSGDFISHYRTSIKSRDLIYDMIKSHAVFFYPFFLPPPFFCTLLLKLQYHL